VSCCRSSAGLEPKSPSPPGHSQQPSALPPEPNLASFLQAALGAQGASSSAVWGLPPRLPTCITGQRAGWVFGEASVVISCGPTSSSGQREQGGRALGAGRDPRAVCLPFPQGGARRWQGAPSPTCLLNTLNLPGPHSDPQRRPTWETLTPSHCVLIL
jgi:hypothetical protein